MRGKIITKQPRTIDETGLSEELVIDLLLKHLADGVVLDLAELRSRLKLSGNIIEPLVNTLRQSLRIEAFSPKEGQSGLRYRLTQLGLADANNALYRSGYLGPAPITLAHYTELVNEQSILAQTLTKDTMKEVFKDVVIDQRNLDVLGPAVFSGRPILVYGQAGTGKSYICKKLAALLGDAVWLPYAIAIGNEIIQYFDHFIHVPVEQSGLDEVKEYTGLNDPRLIYCERPVAISGGELTMDRLELIYDPISKIYQAPIQLKTNSGIYIIDDMGRQRMPPVELFNRWIVPMEERQDYLTLMTGKHFAVPFDCVLIFSSNIHPSELADEAFLRRLGYKVLFKPITQTQFKQIWQAHKVLRGASIEEGVLVSLFERFEESGRDILPCHPRDLMDNALDIGAYQGEKNHVSILNILLAWDNYFINMSR